MQFTGLQKLVIGLGIFYLSVVTGVSGQSAKCELEVNSDLPEADRQPIDGTVDFTTESGSVKVSIALTGFDNTDGQSLHGFHIHELGDLSIGCTSTGSHYNPDNVPHAGRLNATRHVGDLGNIEEDANGNVNTEFTDSVIELAGNRTIVNRAVVIHAMEDDLGVSGDAAGNAGPRLACCIIQSEMSGQSRLVLNTVLVLFMCFLAIAKNLT